MNDSIKEKIEQEEKKKREEYARKRKRFMGRRKLENQGIDKNYQRKKQRGRKLWVFCKDKEERKIYISFLKRLAKEAREVYEAWCRGDTDTRMPIGVFAPRMPIFANFVEV